MEAIQLDLTVDYASGVEGKVDFISKRVDIMNESMGKVRKKLFAEIGQLKSLLLAIQVENESLKESVRKLKNEKTEYIYGQDGNLFDVREYQKAAC